MAAGTSRVVGVMVTTYQHPDGSWRMALRGETVEVHPDHAEVFDADNAHLVSGVAPAPVVDEAAIDDLSSDEPPRHGKGSGRDAWAAHADNLGVLYEDDASRDEIIAAVDEATS